MKELDLKFKNILTVVFLSTFFSIFPNVVRAEYIDSFTSNITIAKDATAVVNEKIAYVFTEDKHGIFRCIPTIHQDKSSSFLKERYIDIEVQSVRMDGAEAPYTVDEARNKICMKIGNPESTINGSHVYEISYTVGGAVSYQAYGGAEWYWNVSGNEWEVPIHSIDAYVSSLDSIILRERACYRGVSGKTDSCQIRTESNGDIHFIGGSQFDPGEGVTIAQALDRSSISYDVRERFKLSWIFAIVSLICIVWGGVTLYRYITEFKTGKTIIPQYEPYPGVKPMFAGFLFDKRLDPRDITACIVYLAKEGFIKIRKIDRKVLFLFEVDDYEIELLRPTQENPDQFESEILTLVFDEDAQVGKKISLSELKTKNKSYLYAIKTSKRLIALGRSLIEDMKAQGFLVGFFFLRRTRKGYEALDHLKGFKDFLQVTETQRYIFHNAPEKNAEQFMEYLPYAIAFGVEKQWAKTFEGITIPNPDWYDGGGVNAFSAASLTQSLGGFSTAFASSSGSSASSGGGSSGGGGGGGGGGSW